MIDDEPVAAIPEPVDGAAMMGADRRHESDLAGEDEPVDLDVSLGVGQHVIWAVDPAVAV